MDKAFTFEKHADQPFEEKISVLIREEPRKFLISFHESKKANVYILTVIDFDNREVKTKYGDADRIYTGIHYNIEMKDIEVHAVSYVKSIEVTVIW